jgi:hypothetical protein
MDSPRGRPVGGGVHPNEECGKNQLPHYFQIYRVSLAKEYPERFMLFSPVKKIFDSDKFSESL